MGFKKIRIRNDDVLVHSSRFDGREFSRFKGYHEIICQDLEHFEHVPAILTTEIQDFPECITYIKSETACGRMTPEVHGLHHIDYAKLSHDEVVDQLYEAKNFIIEKFNHTPTVWYSPWGAGEDKNGSHLRGAAMAVGLNLVTCANIIAPSRMLADVRAAKKGLLTKQQVLDIWEGREILRHWWSGVGALNEIIAFFV